MQHEVQETGTELTVCVFVYVLKLITAWTVESGFKEIVSHIFIKSMFNMHVYMAGIRRQLHSEAILQSTLEQGWLLLCYSFQNHISLGVTHY